MRTDSSARAFPMIAGDVPLTEGYGLQTTAIDG